MTTKISQNGFTPEDLRVLSDPAVQQFMKVMAELDEAEILKLHRLCIQATDQLNRDSFPWSE